MIITIDGPTASGKSSVARALAKDLGFTYIASGLIYRALAYILIYTNDYTVKKIAQPSAPLIKKIMLSGDFVYCYSSKKGEAIFYCGQEITPMLKTPEIDAASSIMSTNSTVRSVIIDYIRLLADTHDVIIDGRDCGSVIFVYAESKFFLTASLLIRAKRWVALQKKLGTTVSVKQATEFIAERDKRDTQRAIGPLIIPDGATVVNNSQLTEAQLLALMLKTIQEKMQSNKKGK